jgi:hypothetical protein
MEHGTDDSLIGIWSIAGNSVIHFIKRYIRPKNGNLKKNDLSKIESFCYADSKPIFILKIVQVLYEKNVFKLDAILISSAYFSVYFDFVRYL